MQFVKNIYDKFTDQKQSVKGHKEERMEEGRMDGRTKTI
jgi:hypothetical protein